MPKQSNWGHVWEQFVDYLVPLLLLGGVEQAIYFHLLRHTRMKGLRLGTLSRKQIGACVGRTDCGVTPTLLTLVRKRCISIRARGVRGLILEVFLPEEIIAGLAEGEHQNVDLYSRCPANQNQLKRRKVFERDAWRCFYCRKLVNRANASLDHLTPMSQGGSPRIENTVACCEPCNREKGTRDASHYLHYLYRAHRLSPAQYEERLSALHKLHLALAKAMDA